MKERQRRAVAQHVFLAAMTYVPLLLTARGFVGGDTKQHLYLDPSRLLARAPHLWDPSIGMGTVTHQNIGYLFPMGPYYWATERIGLPDWVSQRLWLASILFLAAAGVLFLLRTIDFSGPGALVAAVVYALTPYSLAYAARISAILLPFAALPWCVGLMIRALRAGGWRHPALFALVVTAVGGVNATALVYATASAFVWVPFAVWVDREVTGRRALATLSRVLGLTLVTQLWWLVPLIIGGRYGLPVLRVTETIETVSHASAPSEVLRSLGNWFFYGNDKLGPWLAASTPYVRSPALIAATFALPILAIAAAAAIRWRQRAYFIALVVAGMAVAVGAYPYEGPHPLGAALKALASSSTVALALRSTPRAVPVLALGMAVLLGAGISAVARRQRWSGIVSTVAIVALAVCAYPALWRGDVVDPNVRRAEEIPGYWRDATAYLDRRGNDTRVLELPGADFSSYRWGTTVDPVTPALMDRPYVGRELVPLGSAASSDLIYALDRRLQEGSFEPAALGPVARRMAVGDVLLRSDLQFERYRTPRPQPVWDALTPSPRGLGPPAAFGPATPNVPVPSLPMVDEIALGVAPGAPHPPAVAVFPVEGAREIIRAQPAERPLVLAGDGEGLVEAGAAGLLERAGSVLYSGSFARDSAALDRTLAQGADLLVTDSNRRRAKRWSTVRENAGYTEQAGERRIGADPTDARINLFEGATDDAFSVAEHRGVRRVVATAYGNPVSYIPEDRPFQAVDGDAATAWRVAAFSDPRGERLLIELDDPVSADHIELVQPATRQPNRRITEVAIRLDGGPPISSRLGSMPPAGDVVRFTEREFRSVEIEIRDTSDGRRVRYDGSSGVGFAEVRIPGVAPASETIRLPTDLLAAAGTRSAGHALAVQLSRQRNNPAEPFREDEERNITRRFELPQPRRFGLGGTARLSSYAPDEVVDALLGLPGAQTGGVTARSSGRLPGSLAHRASAALDGDDHTAWSPGLGVQEGGFVDVELPRVVTFDRLDLVVVADGRHSVPTRVHIEVDAAPPRVIEIPPIADAAEEGAVARARVGFPAVSTRRIRLVIDSTRPVRSPDYYGPGLQTLPVGIAELGIPGVRVVPASGQVPPICHDRLVEVDGKPHAFRVVGDVAAAVKREGLRLEACAPEVELGAGSHEVRTSLGATTGIDVDRLVLASDRDGRAVGVERWPTTVTPAPGPDTEVVSRTRTAADVVVRRPDKPFWLVLGESRNDGWRATLDGRDLGPSTVVDGHANGWLIDPRPDGADLLVRLRWTPQRFVWWGIAISLAGLLACLVLVAVTQTSRGNPPHPPHPPLLRDVPSPGRGDRAKADWGRTVVAALAAGVVVSIAAGPVVGGLTMAATMLACRVRWGELAVGSAAVAAAIGTGAYVVAAQVRFRHPEGFGWPEQFGQVRDLAWLAVALLAASAIAERAKVRRAV